MPSFRSAVFAVVLVFSIPFFGNPLVAAVGSWSQIGPFGGPVSDIAFDAGSASTAYAATLGDGVFRSTDGGTIWKGASQGLSDLTVRSLAVDSSRPRHLYAASDAGVQESTDGGARWALPVLNSPAAQVEVAPSNPRIVYARLGNGLARSDDGGAHWREIAYPEGTAFVTALVLDPSDAETFYIRRAALPDGYRQLFKTTDGGATWRLLLGLPPLREEHFDLEVAPDRPRTLYASVSYEIEPVQSAVWRSTDGGETWGEPIAAGFPLLALPGGLVVTDYTVSHDFGETWATHTAPDKPGRVLAAHPANPAQLLFAPTSAGIRRSTDGGAEWASSSTGITATRILDLAVGADSTLYAAAFGDGLFRTGNHGRSWLAFERSPGFDNDLDAVIRLAVNPRRPRQLFVTTFGLLGEEMIRTDNGGVFWSELPRLGPPGTNLFLDDFAFNPRAPETVYAVSSLPGGGCRSFRSQNRGRSWQCISLGWASDIEVDPVDPRNVYALSVGPLGKRIAKSTDGGNTWTTAGVNGGLPTNLTLTALTHAPGASGHLFLGTGQNQIFRTTDGGRTWRPATGNLPRRGAPIQALVVDPRDPSRVYAAVAFQGVFRSRNGGRTWSPLPGLPPGALRFDAVRVPLALDPRDSAILYVGSERRGVFAITMLD